MANMNSFHRRADSGSATGGCVLRADDLPRQNQLLAALPIQEYQRLLPHLELVYLPTGWTVYQSGDELPFLYFPVDGMVSLYGVTQSGATAAFAVCGKEGVIGLTSFLGGDHAASEAMVISAGSAYRLKTELLKSEFDLGGALPLVLLRYTQALMVQIGLAAVCHRYCSLEQRLCDWIVSSVDRLQSSQLAMTQELIAQMLGARRESVTAVIARLQKDGLVQCSRGCITVVDRPRLQARARGYQFKRTGNNGRKLPVDAAGERSAGGFDNPMPSCAESGNSSLGAR